ncbi:catechol 2,3-dioxygenase-like lactoylglutathione lyase family enzyme [Actinoalloteichus hoggarensis]|uniref:Glyoxalase-like domain protein n=1 Tax=Actinoalloteichus hoggarensis TaxID=1470176 RepID=A0A221W4Q7_9PSEU|nr:VOC family protein [Actinoalloteichus hoggarensis]ASO20754.1 Glyoxalase-like domain protein [Actinoalloteichus hoggarensis]MBB5920684.1 catechol 2,3-dioxygenase-like lactoylglutathione lyase family enzyme [Actinoalloteichus hoggarensis]
MNWTLEVVTVPVADVDRAKAFYAEKVGFAVDHDTRAAGGPGVVQLTPPGSSCSIVLNAAPVSAEPESRSALQLVVPDVRAARAELAGRGVEVGEVQVAGPEGFRTSTADDVLDDVGFVFFDDPDGNRWAVQQISARA